jgi:alpha-tubulin suppressor-like RCC1 family protein
MADSAILVGAPEAVAGGELPYTAGTSRSADPVYGSAGEIDTLAVTETRAIDVEGWTTITQVEAGYRHTVGLKADGTVVAVRDSVDTDYGECNVGGWTDIAQVTAGAYHTVGLRSDGTVVAVGRNENGECNVGGWTDIIQVSAGGALAAGHTVALKSDGTVVAVGFNDFDQCEVGDWDNIVQVSAGRHFTVGLKADGTALAIGRNYYGQTDVADWEDIVQISAGAWHTVGLRSDGTLIAVGCNDWNDQWGQCEICDWTGVIQASAGGYHTVALNASGIVLAAGANLPRDYGQCDVDGWTDVIQVDAGKFHTAGLKADGTVVAVGGLVASTRCFIATATYGTPMAEEIDVLRQFRDRYLVTNVLGGALADLYYRVSPPVAEFITQHPGLKPMARACLLPAVVLSALIINLPPIGRATVMVLLALIFLAPVVAVAVARRARKVRSFSSTGPPV